MERYEKLIPLAAIMMSERKIILKNFFETYQKLNSFTVMMTLENKLKKLFETYHSLSSFTAMMTVEKEFLKNFCSNLKVWMSNLI